MCCCGSNKEHHEASQSARSMYSLWLVLVMHPEEGFSLEHYCPRGKDATGTPYTVLFIIVRPPRPKEEGGHF